MHRFVGFVEPMMICRHFGNDPSCSSNRSSYSAPDTNKPDAEKFEIEDVVQEGAHLVMKVKYPNCSACAYEGNKVMVFLNTTLLQAMKWKKIDPHFRAPSIAAERPKEAPSPAARFPASTEGWQDALDYARAKARK